MNDFMIKLQAMLDKAKTLTNIKKDIKEIQSKIPPVKLTGELNESKTSASINKAAKKIKPKITVDADTSKLDKTLEKSLKKKRSIKISPSVDSTEFSKTSKEVEKQSQTLFSKLSNNIAGLDITRRVLQEFINSIKNAIGNVKELNRISTDVQMASGSTKSETDGLMSSYHSLAKEISSTTKATAENANTFIRMGESLRDTNTLIKNSQMLSKIGMIENADSADYLISMMKGYQVAARDSINIVDKLTSVDMSAAVSAGGLAQAMSRVSNIANNSGTSMDRLIGYIATVGEVTQKSMSEVGNSFQSIYSRMNNIKIGKFIDDETGEDLSDTEAVLGKIGIKLRENETTYRDFDDVLDDVGQNWTNFNKVEQNSIAVAIAGTRQRENFTALMNNYGSALEYAGIAADSAGTALKRYEVYQDSLEAKTNQLTNAFEGLSVNLIDDDTYAGILDATTALVEFIDKTNLLKGTLAGVATAGILSAFSGIATGAIAAAKSAAQLTSVMAMFNNGLNADNLESIGKACIGLSDNQLKLVLSTKKLKNSQRTLILQGMELNETQISEKLSTFGFANAEQVATGATFSFAGAINTLKTAFATNPIGMSIMAITAAVSVGTMVFSHYKQKQEEALRVAQDAANVYSDTSNSIEDYTKRYEDLHQALIEARGNEEETYNVKKQLLDLQIELNDKYGDEYGKVNLVTDAYKDQTEAIKALNKEAANKILNDIGEAEINDITEKMTTPQTYTLSDQYVLSDSERGKALQELAQKYYDQGIKISNTTMDGLKDTFMITIDANPKDAYETIGSFMSDVRNKANELGDEHLFDGVLEISKSSYDTTAKDIEDLGKTYNEILRAQISRDDKISAQYNGAIQAVKDYNEAVLKSENPYNDQSVKTAYQHLKEVKAGIMDNETEWGKYSSITEDVFDQADTRILDFKSKLSSMNTDNLFGGLQGKIDIEAKALLNANENGEYKDLIALADEYSLSIDDIISSLQNMGIVLDTVANKASSVSSKPFSKIEMITAINEMSEGFESLDKIMSSIKGKNPFDYALLDDKNFKETFSGLGKSYTDFVERISNSPKDVNACQGAFNNLVSTWIKSTGILDQVSDSTASLTTMMLKNMGVTNAEDVVTKALADNHNRLAAEKFYNTQASAALEGATASEISRIIEEGVEAGVTEGALIKLVAEKIVANSTTLSTNGDIENLKALAAQAGVTASAIAQFKTGADGVAGSAGAGKGRLYSNNPEKAKHDLLNSINGAVDANFGTGNTPNTSYGGGTKTNKSGGSKGSKDKALTEFDTAAESIKNLRTQLDSLNDILDNTDPYSQKLDTLKLIIAKQQEYNDALKSQADLYQSEYQKSLATLPQEWQDNITGNKNFSIDEIPDSLKDAVNRAQDFKDKWTSVNQSILKANHELDDTKQKVYDLAQTKLDNQIGLIENKISDVQNKMDEADAMGLQATKKQYKNMISLSKREASVYQDKLEGLMAVMAAMEAAGETDTDNYYKTAEAIQSCEDAISQCAQSQAKWNKAMLELPIQYLEKANDELNDELDGLKDEQSRLDGAINGVTAHLQNQIDIQQKLRDEAEKTAETQIDALQKEKDALQETNDKRKQQLELEKAQYDLERAKNQKTDKIFDETVGDFVYRPNEQAIRDAQDVYDDTLFNKQISDLDDKIKEIEDARDELLKSYDDEIDRLQKIMDTWNDITDAIQRAKDMAMANSILGSGWQDRVDSGDTSDLNNVTGQYEKNDRNQTWVEEQIEANEQLIREVERYVEAWQMGEMSIREARESINDIVGDIAPEIEANDERVNSISSYQSQWTNANQSVNNDIAALNAATTNNVEELTATEQRRAAAQMYADQWATNVLTVGESLGMITMANSDATLAEGEFLNTRITNLTSFQSNYTAMAANIAARCREIVSACREAERAMDRLEKKESGGGYAKGTENAKAGLHPVAEGNKPEIIVNNGGSALLANKETLYPFEGGERVLNASDTKDVLNEDNVSPIKQYTGGETVLNADDMKKYMSRENFTPIDISQLMSHPELFKGTHRSNDYKDVSPDKLMINTMPSYMFDTPKADFVVKKTENPTTNVTIGKIEMHEVNDADGLAKEICRSYESRARQMSYGRKFRTS